MAKSIQYLGKEQMRQERAYLKRNRSGRYRFVMRKIKQGTSRRRRRTVSD